MEDGRKPRRPVVSVQDVHKVYRLGEPVSVLSGVSFELDPGSFTAIMGPSGSGKSTLLNLIGCLDTPTAGRVLLDGRDVTTLSDDERTAIRGTELGFVFQQSHLVARLTVLENVALPLVFRGVDRPSRLDRARDLLAAVGLDHREDHRPTELSGGERQRAALARALVGDPAIVLADEPTGSLDTETGRRIMSLFERVHQDGATILLVTHERHIGEYADRIIHVLDGTIERIETVESPRSSTDPVEGTTSDLSAGEAGGATGSGAD